MLEFSDLAGLLWAKTWRKGWGREVPPGALWHSALAHVLDSAAAGGWLWDHLLAERVQWLLAADLEGRGESARARLAWLAAGHDLGKVTPVFQGLDVKRRAELVAAGLAVDGSVRGSLPHAWLSGRLIFEVLCEEGWEPGAAEWVALTFAGHHGVFPGEGWLEDRVRAKQLGTGVWGDLRQEVLGAAVAGSGAGNYRDGWAAGVPTVGAQLVQAGAVTLSDWLASNEDLFAYEGRLPDGYADLSAERVRRAGEVMGVQALWKPDPQVACAGAGVLYGSRFGVERPRRVQEAVFDLVRGVVGPGLLLVEAPMGEGKTEAALVAAEVLAARLRANGVFFGLPTQATANQIFTRVLGWLRRQGADTTVALAHGKAARQEDYRALLTGAVGVDECGADLVASRWISGRYRALLAPVVVATVDQLLLAGLASRYVSVRMLGLAGKVVVLDEVHAYDAYMSGLLRGVLTWLGACGVPVVLLSATLAEGQRAELLEAYAGRPLDLPEGSAYPRLTWTPAPDGVADGTPRVVEAKAARALTVAVEMLPEPEVSVVVERAVELVAEGGCVLVLRNTVARAQEIAEALRVELGEGAVTLMHARFTVADRSRLESGLIRDFGPGGVRPQPHVVVATQVVEQSLDVSFDALVTDLCPVDLLFQRIGREHRHLVLGRPARLEDPRVVVTGYTDRTGRPPRVPGGARTVYGEHLLWRTAAVLQGRTELELPSDIPELVNRVYGIGSLGPDRWQEDMAAAAEVAEEQRWRMREQARSVALKSPHEVRSLADLHADAPLSGEDDEGDPQVQSVVRLGRPSLEVILLRATSSGTAARTVSQGDAHLIALDRLPDPEAIEMALDQMIRLPGWSEQLTTAAQEAAFTPEVWKTSPWLAKARVLLLPADGGPLRLAGFRIAYCPREGLTVT